MIICGYAGIGKSWLGHHCPNVIDLESTPFEKDWDRYAKCAIHYHKQGYLVLLSCHKEIREKICELVPFGQRLTIVPDVSDKEEYRKRYTNRGNSKEIIQLLMDNWDAWHDEHHDHILREHKNIMLPGETLYDTIIRLSKEPPSHFCNYDGCPGRNKCGEYACDVNPLRQYVVAWTNNQ